ncbi:nucleoid-associated protein [Pseudomonas sp. RG1]|uniref:nucleoid-associated protein n=1 Tax=Pseudomonas sp. RG1 TaxID=2981602 RepID=UPI00221F0961|nr:nucleoid-associated protein [Pseudomonas sp. RG1]MCW0921210.1 nucleoid-associated protein [Pseudomonas sp. RG1]
MRNRVSVLTEVQRNELVVENFIYHILKSGEDEPECLDEVLLSSDTQRAFFKKIISETGQGTQYTFVDKENSHLVTACNAIVEEPDIQFVEQSKEIARLFLGQHSAGQTADGVLIVARVTIISGTSRQSLVALIKLDYSTVLRQQRDAVQNTRVRLEEIIEALSEQAAAVQKKALIQLGDDFAWDVLAVERKKTGAVLDTEDAITDYFKRFLGVRLRVNDSTLTKQMVVACHRWARAYDGDLGGRTPSDVRHSVIGLLDAFADGELAYSEIKDRVCIHTDPAQVTRMKSSFDSHMDELGLGGVSFSPKPGSIPNKDRKGEWITDAGVKVIWQGERNPNILDKTKQADGSYIITIRATTVEERE